MEGQLLQVEQAPNACCADLENRGPVERVNEELTFTRCQVCDRRHFEITVDPLPLTTETT